MSGATELDSLEKINSGMDHYILKHIFTTSSYQRCTENCLMKRKEQCRKRRQSFIKQQELLIASLPQKQLSKPHGEGPIFFALNCSTMPKDSPRIFGSTYDLDSPKLRAIHDKQHSAMSLPQLAMGLVYASELSSASESRSQLANHCNNAQSSQGEKTVHRSLYCYPLSGGSPTIYRTLCVPTASVSPMCRHEIRSWSSLPCVSRLLPSRSSHPK